MPSLFRNTGEQEKQQTDTNPLSPTFGTSRWVVYGVDATACPIPPPASSNFRSAVIAELVYRDNCPSGYFPDGVTYRLEEGFRTSVLSQADADNQARAYFNANSQAFANANDICSPDTNSPTYSCEYDVAGCWTGYVIDQATGDRTLYQTQAQYDLCYVLRGGGQGSQQFCAPV